MSTLKTNNIQHVDRSDPSIIINTDGSVNIAGTMTYEDVTSVDAVGIITARTGIDVVAGDLVIPDSVIHRGDTNTKIRFPSADTITAETGGTERFRIKSDGAIGIGTNNPNTKVHISGADGSTNILRIDTDTTGITINNHTETIGFISNDSGKMAINAGGTEDTLTLRTNGAERLRIKSDGKVGIGTTNPDGKTHIYESSAGSVTAATDANDLVIESSTNVGVSLLTANDSLARIKFGDPDATNAGALVYNHQNDKLSLVTATSNRMVIGSDMISARTDYGIKRDTGGYTFRETDEGSERAGMHSDASNNLIFKAGQESEKVRITTGGDVGINSLAPNTRLDVIGSSASRTYTPGSSVVSLFERNGHCRISIASSASSYGQIDFADTNDDNAGYIRYDHSDNSMSFRTNASDDRLLITSAGLVGIATDTASKKLDIATDAAADGIRIRSKGATYNDITIGANRTGADQHIGRVIAHWNDTAVAYMALNTGSDTTNKDDGEIFFATRESGSGIARRMTIGSDGRTEFKNDVTIDVAGQSNPSADLILKAGEGGNAQIYLYADEGDDNADKWRISAMTGFSNRLIFFNAAGDGTLDDKLSFQTDGTIRPGTDNSANLGTSSYRWANVYTADLHCSNKGSSNDVDGTWGDYTIQEGESDLFLINNRNGKKYKFNLTEVS